MTGEFDFTELGFTGTFTDPTITKIPRNSIVMSETGLSIFAMVYLIGEGYNICLPLNDIVVNDFNYDPTQLVTRVETRLNDFKV